MFLAVDIGNSNVTCGIYNKDQWVHFLRIPSSLNFWGKFLTLQEFPITDVAISSVVPKLTDIYAESIKNIFHIETYVINHKNAGIKIDVVSSEEVGTDRICNCVAAIELLGAPAIIGDIGSATNYDVVNEKKAFIGGSIAPGPETAAKNLFEKAALLKEIVLTVPDSAIGSDTKTNLQSGIMLGAIDTIDGMFKRILLETNWDQVHNIITGGFGEKISPNLKTEHTLMPNLTLDGIRIIYERVSKT